jgi:superfamily II DNA helicase RecQ
MSKRVSRVQYTLNPCKEEIPFNEIKIILRCADEVVARGGRSLLAKILKGSKDKKLLELKLNSCPYYGFYHALPIDEITSKIDRLIEHGYLRIEYDYRLPLIVFTEPGWEIEKDTYADELFEKLKNISETKDFDFIKTLKDRNRGMIFLLLDKIRKSRDARFLPVLEYWKSIDYKKVRARIDSVIRTITEEGRG